MPWIDANGVSIRYELAGSGPVVVLLHEMGGTLESWDGIVPGLSRTLRVLRYDQRGAGLSEKVRQPFTNEMLVDDLEAVLDGLKLTPPFHFVTVAAATAQALVFMQRHPQAIGSFVFCNPLAGIDPSRAGALEERAALVEREGMRTALPVTLDKSWPSDIGDRAAYENYRGRYLAYDPVCFGAVNRMLARTNVTHLVKDISCPTMIVAGRFDQVRPPAGSEQIARSIPGARFELIDAVHMLPAQAPGALLALLQDFLPAAAAPAAQ
ncbi:MAG: alpha/beta fold hydrolase [Xanthobacteraceae bacterium]